MSPPTCPYQDKDCPKIVEIDEKVHENRLDLKEVKRLLYILIGAVMVNWGLTFW